MLVVTYSAYVSYIFFFFNDTATTEIYTLSLHDALPICSTAKGSTTIRRKYTMKIAAATQRQGPRSILRGLKPLPVMVAYLLPRLDRRDTKYTPMVVITSKVIPYAEARPIWLG